MSETFALEPSYGQPRLNGSPLQRALAQIRSWRTEWAAELLQARNEHAMRRALRRLDRRLLRDLGLDRGAC